MQTILEKGDVVRLLSGGPDMTVNKRTIFQGNEINYICVWFDNNNQLQSATFDDASIYCIEEQ